MATTGEAEISARLRGRKNALNRELDGYAPETSTTKDQWEDARERADEVEFRAPRRGRVAALG